MSIIDDVERRYKKQGVRVIKRESMYPAKMIEILEKYSGKQNPTGEQPVTFLIFFPNGYGASIVQEVLYHDDKESLFELAVGKGIDEQDWEIEYSTPITSDVLRRLTVSQLYEIIDQIREL